MTFSTNVKNLNNCDLVFISKDINTDSSGNSDLSEVNNLIDLINQHIQKYYFNSSMPSNPGFTRSLKRNKDFLYYQVETLIFGRAIERALKP